MHTIKITKIDHDTWWGYYVDGHLYGYDDYYNFNDDLISNTLILEAIDKGYAGNSSEVEIVWSGHHNWPNACVEADETCTTVFGTNLPLNEQSLKSWYANWVSDYDEE